MTNENKRERLLENAKTWLHENCPTRLIKDYDASRLADFAAQEVEDAVRAVQNIVHCPTEPYTHNAECWLEYGWIKGENRDHDMLWYNEGNADEFNRWFRALMTKYATDEPSGEMYFKMMIRPDCNFEIICKPKSPELIEEQTK